MGSRNRRFSAAQRWAIYTVHGDRCYWGGEPITLLSMEVDHIIPVSLNRDPVEKASVFEKFGLPNDFSLDSYENWMPCCRSCNREKSDRVFEATALILSKLERARSKAAACIDHERKSLSEAHIAKLLNDLDRAFDVGEGDIRSSSFAKRAAQDQTLVQHETLLESGRFTFHFPANTSGIIVRKISTYGPQGEEHIVSTYSSTGLASTVFDESGDVIGLSVSLPDGLRVELRDPGQVGLLGLVRVNSVKCKLEYNKLSLSPRGTEVPLSKDSGLYDMCCWSLDAELDLSVSIFSISARMTASMGTAPKIEICLRVSAEIRFIDVVPELSNDK